MWKGEECEERREEMKRDAYEMKRTSEEKGEKKNVSD